MMKQKQPRCKECGKIITVATEDGDQLCIDHMEESQENTNDTTDSELPEIEWNPGINSDTTAADYLGEDDLR
jgi:hypothetical protein